MSFERAHRKLLNTDTPLYFSLTSAGYRPVRPGGRRSPDGGKTHRSGVHRTGAGRVYLTRSGQEQARVAAERGLHGAVRLQCIHRASRSVLRIQLPLRVHGLFGLPLLRRHLQRALLLGLDTRPHKPEGTRQITDQPLWFHDDNRQFNSVAREEHLQSRKTVSLTEQISQAEYPLHYLNFAFVKKSVQFVHKWNGLFIICLDSILERDFVLRGTLLDLCRFLAKLFKSHTGTRKDMGMIQIQSFVCMVEILRGSRINRKRTILRTRPYSSAIPSLSLPVIPLAVVSVDYVIHSLRKILICLYGLFKEHLLHYHIYAHIYRASLIKYSTYLHENE